MLAGSIGLITGSAATRPAIATTAELAATMPMPASESSLPSSELIKASISAELADMSLPAAQARRAGSAVLRYAYSVLYSASEIDLFA